jgi:uncharacterized protein DUF4402
MDRIPCLYKFWKPFQLKEFQNHSQNIFMNLKLAVKFIWLAFGGVLTLISSANAHPLPVTVIDSLKFGLLTPGTHGGKVSFPANGSISSTGNVILLGGEQKGMVTIKTHRGRRVQVRVRRGKITGASRKASMKFIGSCIGPGGVLGIRKCSFIATGGVDVVSIGAVLKVRPNDRQPGGHYSGTTRVTAKIR